jgi:hypothetical protein
MAAMMLSAKYVYCNLGADKMRKIQPGLKFQPVYQSMGMRENKKYSAETGITNTFKIKPAR